MKTLETIKTDKKYLYFQLYGFSEGSIVGEVRVNGVNLHSLRGEQASIATAEVQKLLKQGDNMIEIHIEKFAGPATQAIEYALLAAAAGEDGDPFSSDHVIDINEDFSNLEMLPATIQYHFRLDGPAYAVLKTA